MNTKDNQRSRMTRLLLQQAYLNLMQEKQPGKITVKEICERAEINRSSFYLHYQEPNDILVELEDSTIGGVREALGIIGALDDGSTDVEKYMLSFLRYLKKNDELFRTLLVENSDPHFRRKLHEVAMLNIRSAFRLDLPPGTEEAVYRYLISGCIDVLCGWIRDGYPIADRTLCRLLMRLCIGSLQAVG